MIEAPGREREAPQEAAGAGGIEEAVPRVLGCC